LHKEERLGLIGEEKEMTIIMTVSDKRIRLWRKKSGPKPLPVVLWKLYQPDTQWITRVIAAKTATCCTVEALRFKTELCENGRRQA
jgi:hypothetical protein